ncbi:hypothetical protein OCF84_21050 (plasmid) [Shewanella xiamenensis]|uniref:Uncharacterized protein n=1 Tax=Shewanella xiamenensis TaxID=332186 RepID=A0ABT6UH82_9GAMM|nr:hypothetical protein [Shewanella xiamenensis]MDI5832634.1 hypothetical protein [Shewanella xiamenensis]WHF58008.1 hypothetical protein OCF84_21050 [Shewanella xiamenensis]
MNQYFQDPMATRLAHIGFHMERSLFANASEHQKSKAFIQLAKGLMERANLSDEIEYIEASNQSDVSAIRLIPLKLIYSYPKGFTEIYKFDASCEEGPVNFAQELPADAFLAELNRLADKINAEYSCKLEEIDAPNQGDALARIYMMLQHQLYNLEITRALDFFKQCSTKVAAWGANSDSVKTLINKINCESVLNQTISIQSEALSTAKSTYSYQIHDRNNTETEISFVFDFKLNKLSSGENEATLPSATCQRFDKGIDVYTSLTEGIDIFKSEDQFENIVGYLYGKGFELSDEYLSEVKYRNDYIQLKHIAKYRSFGPLEDALARFNARIPTRKPIYNVNTISDLFEQFNDATEERKRNFACSFTKAGIDIDQLVSISIPPGNPKFRKIADNAVARLKETDLYSYILTAKLTNSLDSLIEDLNIDANASAEDSESNSIMSL